MMENNNVSNFQRSLTDNLRQASELSFSLAKPLLDAFVNNFSSVSQSMVNNTGAISIPQFKLQSSDCCAPKNECPPKCLASITKNAMPGERVIVPFIIRNSCNVLKTYRVGVRELKDVDGNNAPTQPVLSKSSITVDAGQQERVFLIIDLKGFAEGKSYTTDIVLREKEYNQNICFTLNVGNGDGVVIAPLDEKKYRLRWQSWKDHFYCERSSTQKP